MSLNWNLTKIANYKEVCWVKAEYPDPSQSIEVGDEILNPVTNALIWHCAGVGIGEITEKNAFEFYCRVAFIEKLYGVSLRKKKEDDTWVDRPITLEDVRQHIGLVTNVFPKETQAKWLKRHYENFERDRKYWDEKRYPKGDGL